MFQHPWDNLSAYALPPFVPAQAGSVEGSSLDRPLVGSGGSVMAPEGVVCQPSVPAGRRTP